MLKINIYKLIIIKEEKRELKRFLLIATYEAKEEEQAKKFIELKAIYKEFYYIFDIFKNDNMQMIDKKKVISKLDYENLKNQGKII
jgi:predicted patatin/cPLA2 family phospholipase